MFIELNSLKSSLTTSGLSSYPSLPSPKQRHERLSPMTASLFRYLNILYFNFLAFI